MTTPLPLPEEVSPTSLPLPDPEAYEGEPREYARALMQRKTDIEQEIDRLHRVLRTHNADSNTSLIDPEGYPRGDIDVYSIRHARSSIARLTTDRRTVENLLPRALEAAFAAPPLPSGLSSQTSSQSNTIPNGHSTGLPQSTSNEQDEWPSSPVARVNSVAPSSPAHESGLQAGDVIFSFAGVTSEHGLQAIGALVQRSEGAALKLLVLREVERKELVLTPRSGWGGRGSLGCHIVPA